MTLQELRASLDVIRGHESPLTHVSIEAVAMLYGLGWIAGSEGQDSGVYLTEAGRRWLREFSYCDRRARLILVS